uniref:Uncharacterized protein n=1 Tax=Anopheles albimanus TaxID=7167 RepID=A0A182FZ01_ANOAL
MGAIAWTRPPVKAFRLESNWTRRRRSVDDGAPPPLETVSNISLVC